MGLDTLLHAKGVLCLATLQKLLSHGPDVPLSIEVQKYLSHGPDVPFSIDKHLGPDVPVPNCFLQDGPDEPPDKVTEEDGPEVPPSDDRVKSPLCEPDAPVSASGVCLGFVCAFLVAFGVALVFFCPCLRVPLFLSW